MKQGDQSKLLARQAFHPHHHPTGKGEIEVTPIIYTNYVLDLPLWAVFLSLSSSPLQEGGHRTFLLSLKSVLQ